MTSSGIGTGRLECRENGRLALVTSSSLNHDGHCRLTVPISQLSIRCLKMGFTKASTVRRTYLLQPIGNLRGGML